MTNQGHRDSKIRVLCVDDHALMREAIAAVIRNEPDMVLAAQVCSGHEAIQGLSLTPSRRDVDGS